MTVRAITFDCYGTLVDWEAGIRSWAEKLLARKGDAGKDVTPEEITRRWEEHQFALLSPYRGYRDLTARAAERVLRDLKIPVEPQDGQSLADAIVTWRPFPDTGDCLRRLGGRYKVGVISNMDNVVLFETVSRLGAPVHMRTSAEDARAYKPDPAPFKLCLTRLGLEPEWVMHAACNFRYDLDTAGALGMRTAYVDRGANERGEADLRVKSLSELADRLLSD
jgi:2-haloalkanoic acid dehalogenase type II